MTPETFDEWLDTIPEVVILASESEDFARRLADCLIGVWQVGTEHGRTVALADVGDGKVSQEEIEKARGEVIAAADFGRAILAVLSGAATNTAH